MTRPIACTHTPTHTYSQRPRIDVALSAVLRCMHSRRVVGQNVTTGRMATAEVGNRGVDLRHGHGRDLCVGVGVGVGGVRVRVLVRACVSACVCARMRVCVWTAMVLTSQPI